MSITRTTLQRLPNPELPSYESRLVRPRYPPDVAVPLFNHPVAATGIDLEGGLISQWAGSDELEHYRAGNSFVDHGETLHVRSENSSKKGRFAMVLSYVVRVDEVNVNMT